MTSQQLAERPQDQAPVAYVLTPHAGLKKRYLVPGIAAILAASVAGFAGIIAIGLRGGISEIAGLAIVGGGLWVGILGLNRFVDRRSQAALDPTHASEATMPERIARTLARTAQIYPGGTPMVRANERSVTARAAEALSRAALSPHAWRFGNAPASEDQGVPPRDDAFEPVVLSMNDPRMRELASTTDMVPSAMQVYWREYYQALNQAIGRSRIIRIAFFILAGLMMLSVVWNLLHDLLSTNVAAFWDSFGLPLGVFLLLTTVGVVTKAITTTEWWLVPGAIVVRRTSWRQTGWSVEVFPRETSHVVYWADAGRLAVAGANGAAYERRVSAIEAQAALRAFLSPLPPPRVEELSDLH